MPHFVILEHFLPSLDRPDHFDLMFSQPGWSLQTWSIRGRPDAPGMQSAQSLPDHRTAYLTHQGLTKRGLGWVRRWTGGSFRPLVQRSDCRRMIVDSPRLCGLLTLERTADGWHYSFTRRF
jgi:hypothetical protein